jgi:hypothetical protein
MNPKFRFPLLRNIAATLAGEYGLSGGGVMVPRWARARTLDELTLDQVAGANQAINQWGDQRGVLLGHQYRTHDADSRPMTLENGQTQARTVDSTGAFLVGELERVDPTLHLPLSAVTWSRDIDVRTDVTLVDEFSSYTITNFASAGNLGTGQGIRTGKAWMGKNTDQIAGVSVDNAKTPSPLTPWGLELKWTVFELEMAARVGRPIDEQKLQALHLKHQMDIDEQAYVGDSTLAQTGMLNSGSVTNVTNVPNGAGGSPLWGSKTPAEILADLNAALQSAWAASAYAVMPRNILIPPTQFGTLSTQLISTAGNTSILKYLLENNIVTASGNGNVSIKPVKWLVGAGVGGTIGVPGNDRMVLYSKDRQYIRFPMVPLQRTPVQFMSIYHLTTYYCRLGVVEVVYPETIAYRDGI